MRPFMVLVLLAASVAGPVAGQGPDAYPELDRDPAPVHAPVQLLVDLVPDIVRTAVEEALFDGTPDAAAALLARAASFATGFDTLPPWPQRSIAATADAEATYTYGMRVVTSLRSALPAIGMVARTDAACVSWARDADSPQFWSWYQETLHATAVLEAEAEALRALAAEAPPAVDAGPLTQAAVTLQARLAPAIGRTQVCLEEVAIRVGGALYAPGSGAPEGAVPGSIPPQVSVLAAWLVPERSWPTGEVVVIGRAAEPVSVDAPTLGWAQTAPAGAFRMVLGVPRDASLGPHDVRVAAGPLSVPLTLQIGRAPANLYVQGPSSGAPGAEVALRVHLLTPAPGLLGPEERVHGNGQTQPLLGGAPFNVTLPTEGELRLPFTYPGSDAIRPAETVWVLLVREPAATAPSSPEPPPWRAAPDLSLSPWLLAAAVLLAIAVAGAVNIFSSQRRRRQTRPGRRPSAAAPSGPLPRGLVAAFAAFVSWLVSIGAARRSSTAREVGRSLGQEGIPIEGLVSRFERARYGGEPEPSGDEASDRLERLRHRMRRP